MCSLEKLSLSAKRKTNPTIDVSNSLSKGICASGASSNISGKRSNSEREIKSPLRRRKQSLCYFSVSLQIALPREWQRMRLSPIILLAGYSSRIILDLSDSL
jgi:hypothetical protein